MVVHVDPSPNAALRRFGNTLVSVKLSHADGADGISIIEHWMPHGDSPPLHVHLGEDEVFHVVEGTLRLVVGGRERIAGPGDTVLAPKGVPHGYRVESEGGARCLTVVRGGDFEAMVTAASRPTDERALPVPEAPTPEAIARLERLCRDNRIAIVGPPLG